MALSMTARYNRWAIPERAKGWDAMLGRAKRRGIEELFALEGHQFTTVFNAFNALYWRFPFRVTWDNDTCRFSVSSAEGRLVFARKERIWLYAQGIERRLQELRRVYMLDRVPLRPDEFVLDCGANVGEFSRAVHDACTCRVIAVEPEPLEAACIRANVHGIHAVLTGVLWKEQGAVEFVSKPDSADSAILEVAGSGRRTQVTALTLTSVFQDYAIDRLRLLKLEAEGAEPEVLEGGLDVLQRIDYITADLGPERGATRSTTVAPVANLLFSRGFELIDVSHPRLVCLFRNVATTAS